MNDTLKDSFIPKQSGDRILILIAFIGVFVLSYLLLFVQMESRPDSDAIEIGTVKVSGVVRRRHAKTLQWGNISKSSKVYLRDIIYTPKDSTAEIQWGEDQRFRLEPESMIQLDQSASDKIEIVLFEGKVSADGENNTPGQTVEKGTGRKKTLVIAKKGKSIESIKQNDGSLTSIDTGDLSYTIKTKEDVPVFTTSRKLALNLSFDTESSKLRTEELTQRLKESGIVQLESDIPVSLVRTEIKISDYEIRTLSPLEGKYSFNKRKWMGLTWQDVPFKVTYEVDISKTKDFSQKITQRTRKNELKIQLEDGGQYYWKVRALSRGGWIESKASNFEIVVKNGADILSRFPASTPSGYFWEWSEDVSFNSVFRSGISNEMKCPTNNMKAGQQYYCRVKSKDDKEWIAQYPYKQE